MKLVTMVARYRPLRRKQVAEGLYEWALFRHRGFAARWYNPTHGFDQILLTVWDKTRRADCVIDRVMLDAAYNWRTVIAGQLRAMRAQLRAER